MEEKWKDIQGYEGLYQISNTGKVKSLKRNKNLKGHIDKSGYYRVILYNNQKYKNYQIHRLVALAFIPNPDNKPQVDHINTIRTDNSVSNLRWVTYKENNLNPITLNRYKNMNRPPISEKTKRKMSESAKKRIRFPTSANTKSKQSKSRIEFWIKKKGIKAIKCTDCITKEVKLFHSIKEAIHFLGTNSSTLSKRLNSNSLIPYKTKIWEYVY